MNGIAQHIRRVHRVTWCLVALCCASPASAAPVIESDFDLFDQLATTFPIEDWIMRALAHSDDLERRVVQVHPRFSVARAVTVGMPLSAAWDDGVGCGIRRLARNRRCPAVTDDPCATINRDTSPRSELPSFLGERTMASLGIGPDPMVDPSK